MKAEMGRGILAIASVLGIGVSSFLFDEQTTISVCELGSIFSCEGVLTSEYSHILGVPMSVYGFAWFAVVLALVLLSYRVDWAEKPLWGWSALGMVGVGALLYWETLIGEFCIFCTMAHLIGITIVVGLYEARGTIRSSRHV